MNLLTWIALVSVLSVVDVLCAPAGGTVVQFEPSRVKAVDKQNKNYLLRGNIPLVDGEFSFSALTKRIAEVTKLKPSEYNLKVVSLMNHLTDKESTNLKIEEDFFREHPELGELILYPILGFVASPESLPEIMVDIFSYFFERFSYDKVDAFLTRLHEYMESEKTTVIYFHCSHGIDRTGYVSGAYRLKYQEKSLRSILKENVDIGQRDMIWTTYNGLIWYCEHLQRTRKGLDCGEKGGEYDQNRVVYKPSKQTIGLDDEL